MAQLERDNKTKFGVFFLLRSFCSIISDPFLSYVKTTDILRRFTCRLTKPIQKTVDNSLNDMSALDDDLARMYLESSSSEKEISDDDMNLEV